MSDPMTAEELQRRWMKLIFENKGTTKQQVHDLVQSLITAHRRDAARVAYVKAAEAIEESRDRYPGNAKTRWGLGDAIAIVHVLLAKHDAGVKDGS